MALIPAFGSEPEVDADGLHFEMKAAATGRSIRCSLDPDVFADLNNEAAAKLKFFSDHFPQIQRVAMDLYAHRDPRSDEPIKIRRVNLLTRIPLDDFS